MLLTYAVTCRLHSAVLDLDYFLCQAGAKSQQGIWFVSNVTQVMNAGAHMSCFLKVEGSPKKKKRKKFDWDCKLKLDSMKYLLSRHVKREDGV